MSQEQDIDLNAVRSGIRRNQESGIKNPSNHDEKIFVDKEGKIKTGTMITIKESRTHSVVPQETFAGVSRADKSFMKKFMPSNAKIKKSGDIEGILYTITCEYENDYTLLAFRDETDYKVLLIDPMLEGTIGGHAGHLYGNGTICLAHGGGGVGSLEEAYSKSAMWATGVSLVRMGHGFPFAYDQ